jgi:hypothetical protein
MERYDEHVSDFMLMGRHACESELTFPINPRKTATPNARNDVVNSDPTYNDRLM